MLAPISWLKDYVDINVSPQTLAKKLVSIGFEVEEIIYQEKQVTNVVAGKILSVDKHPNADRLRVAQINVGAKVIQVVTNVALEGGETVAVALDGAVLSGNFKIKSGEMRGVLSEGMLCGLEELGLTDDDVDGQISGDIIRFDSAVPAGAGALKALGYDDVILDIGVTANRPDCNSIYKLAKETAVALKTECREPEIDYISTEDRIGDMLSVEVKNSALCPRYMAAGITDVKIFPSSAKIKSRLRAVGIRPINNIVDITNYVLIEIGQPMHAFDSRDIKGNKIVVRNALEGEKIISLDGKNNTLNENMLVICDAEKPIAIAGVMGGENSGIKQDSTSIIFESARFARDSIRRTSRALNLRSDSSARFEKGVDFASQEYGLKRALTLVYQSGSAKIVQGIIDESVDYDKSRKISFSTKKLQQILGCRVPKNSVVAILGRLGIDVKDDGGQLIASIPEDREDIAGVNDLAEEFIRVYGYSHVKPTLFEFAPLTKGGKSAKTLFADRVKDALAAAGFMECVTYSFTSPKFADMLLLPCDSSLRKTIPLLNPLGEALSVMRTTLVHSMLEILASNISHFNKQARFFELGKVYLPKQLPLEELPYEEERLSVGMYGGDADFYVLKGALEALFRALNLKADYRKAQYGFLHPGRSAAIFVRDTEIGFLGEIHPDAAQNYGVEGRLYAAELSLDKLFELKGGIKGFEAFSRFPAIERDLAVVVNENTPAGALVEAVNGASVKFLKNAAVFDTYKGEQIGKGKKSVAMSFEFSSLERTLTDEEVNEQMSKILGVLKRKAGAAIRL